MPVSGHAARLVTADFGVFVGSRAEASVEEVHWVSGSGPGRKRIRLNRQTPAHLVGSAVIQCRPRVWKRLHCVGHSVVSYALCCSFACRTPTWRLPVPGRVVDLVTASVGAVQEAIADSVCQEVHRVSGSGPGRKRIRLNRKTAAHLAGLVIQSRSRVWKRLRHVGHSVVSLADCKRRRYNQHDEGYVPEQHRTGVG